MSKKFIAIIGILLFHQVLFAQTKPANVFPDGSRIPAWFSDTTKIPLSKLGKQYVITRFGAVGDSTVLQTTVIQKTIDAASQQGGGVVVIPQGTYLSGALFFKPKTHLYLAEGAVLKGSDEIKNYPKIPSRMEGQSLDYFAALVNVYQVDGFTITGKGKIDGNGLRYWEAFWARRKENPNCTNLEVSRPRLVFVWKSNNVQMQDVKLHNSGFWTNHFYQCNNVKLLNLHIFSPYQPVKAPSTDAIDLDNCSNVLVSRCYLSVNDDAIALKGGKGPWADLVPNNGENTNIIIENCHFGYCHSALTCGSEAIHNKNIVMRNCHVNQAERVLWLKMRPDTPQLYEYVTVDNITGQAKSLLYVKPWTQFFDLQGRQDPPHEYCRHISLKNIRLTCQIFFDVAINENNHLSDFVFDNLTIEAKNGAVNKDIVKGFTLRNVLVNQQPVK
ncbi:rhamnogalacturonidase [Arsenicibacter rosenii]|uniref:Exopolygalacturonase n=1 Tax=Arsenicibacter rosenii TaxID=1750698 RepID=A0A1S2VJU5_9BACT|nr:glycosyl hydrolase family 28 protein [Arsenicibacter rosenii]OIN59029.1 exopolygalacturonase [Arsenicibacter rosenii]